MYVRGDENINSLIEEYVDKELMRLDNVKVTYSKLDCAIDIVVKEITIASGTTESEYKLSINLSNGTRPETKYFY